MTRLRMVPALLLLGALGACDSGILDVLPQDEIAEEIAIVDRETAEAALMGAYGMLTDTNLYGGDYLAWTDLLSDDVEHTGTFGSYGQADLINVPADNGVVYAIWVESYEGINRVNVLIEKLADLDLDQAVEDRILGQAYTLRALHYFNLVRAYGGVPLVLQPPASLEEASQVSRAPVADVWAQIEADLNAAETRLAGASNSGHTLVTPGFVDALQAKAHLYQEDWEAAEAAAREVVNSGNYQLAASYGDLFEANGAPTDEDIFRVQFIATNANNFGYYYQYAGRFEIGSTQALYDAYDQANDERWAYMYPAAEDIRPDGIEVVKYPTTAGTENIHVIRYGEVLLILAEALAEQGGAVNLTEAVSYLNEIRDRAGVAPYLYGVDLTTQQEVLDAIYLERRLELAFEGERWFDLVRSGRAAAALGAAFSPYEAVLPIPQAELDVAPNMDQNPQY